MNVPPSLESLVGRWAGTSRLWLEPGGPARESDTLAQVSLAAQGRFLVLQYTWADEGAPQDGLLVLGRGSTPGALKAMWVDSWHLGEKPMLCAGTVAASGAFSVLGAYAAPPGPDWGWRISLEPQADEMFQLSMHNITPAGQEALAVAAAYTRQA